MINGLLSTLDFSEKESAVYLALLEIGSGKAATVSRKTGLNRTTVYDVFDALLQKGLVSKYKKGSATYFNALEPKHLLTYLDREREEQGKKIDRQKQQVLDLLPQLISLQNITTSKPKVTFFEGEKGMREAYEDTLTANGMLLAYANIETIHEGLPNFFPEYYKRRVANKIFGRGIAPRNPKTVEQMRNNREEMRDVRFLPDSDMTFTPEVNIYNDKMLIVSWKEKMAIIIESKELADLQRLTFELLWKTLPRHIPELDA